MSIGSGDYRRCIKGNRRVQKGDPNKPLRRIPCMRMAKDELFATFSHVVTRISEQHPNLAYIHVVEPDAERNDDRVRCAGEWNDFIQKMREPRPIISAGGYNRESALKVAEDMG
ncbi:hypothetical protein A0H81_14764 [Grifola frondosa]|uniref:NADH:flavin oxidoreductase/NADH oxidase N-terminal domain-containing protein n=1 Tax=Grifola frondosa TaxID=5627 RepID=A0A1C7LL89_GRIFR|nr:hypothetical protein A0H81_14764 [Grifola frondosa]